MCDNYLISVIVPVYNGEKYIQKCIESIQKQTFSKIEIIIVDDGSTDNTKNICNNFINLDERVKYYYITNSGVSKARNYGLMHAQGDFISFVDSDDWIDADMLEVLLSTLLTNNADFSYCFAYDYPCECNGEVFLIDPHNYNFIDDYMNVYTVWASLFKRNIVNNIFFDSSLCIGEDSLYRAQVIYNSSLIACVKKKMYHYITHDNSAWHSSFKPQKLSEFESWKRIIELYKERRNTVQSAKERYSASLYYYLVWYYKDLAFKEYRKEVLSEYRRNIRYMISSVKSIKSKVLRMCVYCFPYIFIPTIAIKQLRKTVSHNENENGVIK
ncbi:MAG: glycosyltransferase family 2 protein [Candidatus Coproplasma sp.]